MGSTDMEATELHKQALEQFDILVEKGEILWSDADEIKVEQKPFDVYFRVSTSLTKKPYKPGDKSGRAGFLDEDPLFKLTNISPSHELILNKFCWLRPQMILHTSAFENQTDLLTQGDFEAAWEVLLRLGSGYMAIFNGGPDAGSSVAHKHLQVFPRPAWKMFADVVIDAGDKGPDAPKMLIRNRLSAIPNPSETTGRSLFEVYSKMCDELSVTAKTPHNLLLVKEWIMVIPRSCATMDGEIEGANLQGGANAMLGMLWLKTPDQLKNWKTYGPMEVLTKFGVAEE